MGEKGIEEPRDKLLKRENMQNNNRDILIYIDLQATCQANEFLAYSHTIPQQGDVTDYIDEDELARLKNEARFLRAYYHYLLFELYGPIPIMTEISEPSASDLDYYRNSVDEVVQFK